MNVSWCLWLGIFPGNDAWIHVLGSKQYWSSRKNILIKCILFSITGGHICSTFWNRERWKYPHPFPGGRSVLREHEPTILSRSLHNWHGGRHHRKWSVSLVLTEKIVFIIRRKSCMRGEGISLLKRHNKMYSITFTCALLWLAPLNLTCQVQSFKR